MSREWRIDTMGRIRDWSTQKPRRKTKAISSPLERTLCIEIMSCLSTLMMGYRVNPCLGRLAVIIKPRKASATMPCPFLAFPFIHHAHGSHGSPCHIRSSSLCQVEVIRGSSLIRTPLEIVSIDQSLNLLLDHVDVWLETLRQLLDGFTHEALVR